VTTVTIPPDYLTAWIGVAGVVIGFVLSTVAQLVRDARKDRKEGAGFDV
jgi:hypothetical protein